MRQAFLKVIPRQAILDAIIIPQKADASILNSQLFVPAQAAYADSVANNGSDQFPGEPDIEGAKLCSPRPACRTRRCASCTTSTTRTA